MYKIIFKLKPSDIGIWVRPSVRAILWWVDQTGIVYVFQSACCELWLCLVRLDWHPHSTRCHLFIQMLRTRFNLPVSEFTDHLIAQISFHISSHINRIPIWAINYLL